MSFVDIFAKKKIYDISVSLSQDLPVFPGQPRFEKKILMSMERDDRANTSHLSLTSHTGTHVDSPYHFISKGIPIDKVPIKNLIGFSRVVEPDVNQKIEAQNLESFKIQNGEIIIIKTRNSSLWKMKNFVKDYIFLTGGAAKYLSDKKVKAVGFDYIIPEDLEDLERPVHNILLGKNIILIEGLDLTDVPCGEYFLICLPLKIEFGDAAPARAILIEM